jgi:hypothetical protein
VHDAGRWQMACFDSLTTGLTMLDYFTQCYWMWFGLDYWINYQELRKVQYQRFNAAKQAPRNLRAMRSVNRNN